MICQRESAKGKRRYQVRVDYYDPLTGARKRYTIGTYDLKRDAAAVELATKSEIQRGLFAPSSLRTVNSLTVASSEGGT
jgi:hypothetical protein